MRYYAHTIDSADESKWHFLKEHLLNTASIASQFASVFRGEAFGYAAGLLHDIGKYSEEFQMRLRGAPIQVDHSTAGAQEAMKKIVSKPIGLILAYVISGHHTGLPNYGSAVDPASLQARLSKPVPDYNAYCREIEFPKAIESVSRLPIDPNPKGMGFSVQFFIRMLFSCLVDADFLDTESAVQPEQYSRRGGNVDLSLLLRKLEQYMNERFAYVDMTPVNLLRSEILTQCIEQAAQPQGFFSLTVPTGGGKTLASLAFALRHAVKHRLNRIIYIIPYTSIIEQNAKIFREALGDENVLEHHSYFQFDFNEEGESNSRLRLASENWDVPLIVTTNVQFFESLFSNRGSRCRKLHNIAKSVLILDEAQMLPTSYLIPCLWALDELVHNYGSTVLLCTATQPSIQSFLPRNSCPVEIVSNPRNLQQAFKRVHVEFVGELADEQLVEKLSGYQKVLCIVNTRNHAASLFERMRGPGVFHLSAKMYPVHRSKKLDQIRKYLLDEGTVCRVISTQLIEAGVDVDFPVVFRSIAGIDSIAQAAGRCNREGRLKSGEMFVFKPEASHKLRGWFQRTATITEMILRNHDDLLSLDAIEAYFQLLYQIEDAKLDEKQIIHALEESATSLAFPFRDVSENFQLIDSPMVSIIVPFEEVCADLVDEARWKGPSRFLTRQLQPYVVQIYQHEYNELCRLNAIEMIAEQYAVLTEKSLYDDDVGLIVPNSRIHDEPFIF